MFLCTFMKVLCPNKIVSVECSSLDNGCPLLYEQLRVCCVIFFNESDESVRCIWGFWYFTPLEGISFSVRALTVQPSSSSFVPSVPVFSLFHCPENPSVLVLQHLCWELPCWVACMPGVFGVCVWCFLGLSSTEFSLSLSHLPPRVITSSFLTHFSTHAEFVITTFLSSHVCLPFPLSAFLSLFSILH